MSSTDGPEPDSAAAEEVVEQLADFIAAAEERLEEIDALRAEDGCD